MTQTTDFRHFNSEQWKEDCLKEHGRILTGEKGHWCKEWDYMPIDETCKEYEACVCPIKQ